MVARFVNGFWRLALAAVLSGSPYEPVPKLSREVYTGQIGYATIPLRTQNVVFCSVIAVDYGNGAFLAHALPIRQNSSQFTGSSTVENVVERLVVEIRAKGFDERRGVAYINAGSREDLSYLERDLRSKGIVIQEANIEHAPIARDLTWNPAREVSYDPHHNILSSVPQITRN